MTASPWAGKAGALRPGTAAAATAGVTPFAVGLLLAAALQYAVGPAVGPFFSDLLIKIGINVILAVSLNVVNGYTGQFSIGHAGFMAVGGYAAGALTYYTSMLAWGGPQVQGGVFGVGSALFVGACLVGGLVAAAAGWAVGLPSLRLRGDYLAIVTLGFGEIVRVLLQQTQDVPFTADEARALSPVEMATHLGGSLGFSGIPFYTNLFWVWCFVTLTLLVAYRLKESTFGRAFLSIRENEIAAEAMGVDTTRYKVRAFVIAAFFAGVAGALFAHKIGTTLNPRELGFMKSFDIVIMVVLGGMGSISGATIAAVLLTVLPEALRGAADYRMIVYALMLVLVMIVRPQGLFGIREIWELPPFARRRGR
ncbi:branched-chain amino acid ABC transporter permease [Myxococcota bacterium]|nr:branched-chain amino acid ABC transporter permease [Myxococcota bacterium]